MGAPSVVLVDRSPRPVGAARLVQVARALQTQVDRDFGAAWGVRARVSAADGPCAPAGAWPIYLVGPIAEPLGVHLHPYGHPYAVVRAGPGWTLAASHLLMEMLADPDGDRLVEAPSIASCRRRRPVRYLVEACDPCRVYSYVVGGVVVADFVTPDYFRTDGFAVDFLRMLRRPLEVPEGCSLAWQDPRDRHWYERRPDGCLARSQCPVDPRPSPRDDRHRAFPEQAGRHDLSGLASAVHMSSGG